jgi:hypothetical protein
VLSDSDNISVPYQRFYKNNIQLGNVERREQKTSKTEADWINAVIISYSELINIKRKF